ncbi:exported hypothetical protein [Tenacibaculum litopenaei]|uniref:TlpA family protein disulfide reductase n=1 Tax=Tenacibaculum litopenaei TaxID=396016 RepID=UPI003893E64E
MKRMYFLIAICCCQFLMAQEYPFLPKGLKELPFEEVMSRPLPKKLGLVFFEDGTKTDLSHALSLITSGTLVPKVFVNAEGANAALVLEGGRYSFVPDDLKLLPLDQVQKKGIPTKVSDVFYENGTRLSLQKAIDLVQTGKAMPLLFVNAKGDYKAMVVVTYKDDGNPYDDIPNPTGEQAKAFTVETVTGKRYTLSELKGKTVVLNFWFIECPPCVKEIPLLNALRAEYKGNDKVVFLGIAMNSKRQLTSFLRETPFNYEIVPRGTQLSALYGVQVFPTHFVIDPTGKISYFAVGGGKDVTAELRKQLPKK